MSALNEQAGGSHYKGMAIQPVEFIQKNGIPYIEGNVIKYVTRHKEKGGRADLEKAIHYLQLLLELEYPEAPIPTSFTTNCMLCKKVLPLRGGITQVICGSCMDVYHPLPA